MITDFTPSEQATLDGFTGWEEFYSKRPTVERITTGHYWDNFLVTMLLRDRIISEFTFSEERRVMFQKGMKILDEIDARVEAGEVVSPEEQERLLKPHRDNMEIFNNPATPDDYGVCDTPEQVLERWPQLMTDPRRFMIFFTEIRKEEQPAHGGWRWHKWGEYIGTKEPQYEYLAEEEDIDSVLCFHIFQMKCDD